VTIFLKTEEHIENIRRAGKIASTILSALSHYMTPGVTTKYIDGVVEQMIKEMGGTAPCKGYTHGNLPAYPAASCISINAQAVHCLPSDLIIKEGDVVKIDLVVGFNGWNADTARTYLIPPVRPEVQKFVETTYLALWKGIGQAIDGRKVVDISKAVFDARNNYGVVSQFCGHGIGKSIHEDPKISNIPREGDNTLLCAGMVICVEPIFTLGKPDVYIKEGDWNTYTLDGSLVSHFEHTCIITEGKPEIVTLREEEKSFLSNLL
jgi:methionyl aminopeptidase